MSCSVKLNGHALLIGKEFCDRLYIYYYFMTPIQINLRERVTFIYKHLKEKMPKN